MKKNQIRLDAINEVESALSGNNQINWHNNIIIHDLVFSTINNLKLKRDDKESEED